MRYFVWLILVLSLTLLAACSGSVVQERQATSNPQRTQSAQGQEQTKQIKQLSDFELQMLDPEGKLKPLKLSQTLGQGKVVVIDFWATWCGPCRQSIPDLVALHNEYNNKGVEIYGLSVEDPDEVNRLDPSKKNQQAVVNMSKDYKMNYRVGFATQSMFAAFDQRGMGSIPQTFIFGKDGNLVKHLVGFNPNAAPRMIRDSIDKALNS
ncbi:MAG TPA: TlpA disulfide reductase family protein [Blastocatellia bacterium]|nr:TlpA disulfide reductase family protein [Blastocatellia bacterium]